MASRGHPTFTMSASTLRRSHGGPGLVEERYIVSHQVEDFGSVRAVGTRALDVALAAEFVRERPSHAIGDEPAFDAEDDVAEERHPAGWPDTVANPPRGGRIGVEKTSERGATLPRVDVERPARHVADHDLRREVVALDPGRLRCSQDRSATRGHNISPVRRNPSRATSTME
jgi:hypothetical protein